MAVENLNLNSSQALELWQAIKAKGANNQSNHPQYRNHWRLSIDNTKGIFEALFAQDNMAVDWFKDKLANIFGVNPATIDHGTQMVQFANRNTPIVTFSRTGTDYMRVAVFGSVGATWNQSRIEANAYMKANLEEWE
jgi:hypothetical protein